MHAHTLYLNMHAHTYYHDGMVSTAVYIYIHIYISLSTAVYIYKIPARNYDGMMMMVW